MVPKFEVARFDGTGNFRLWETRVKDLLVRQGILKTLSDQKPTKVDDDKWDEMKAQASTTIRMCISDQIMYHVMEETSPKKIWDKLDGQFMSKTVTRKLYLKQKLFGLKMQEGSDLAEHINVFNQSVANLVKVEVTVEDEDRAIILLCSLPGSYEHLVTTLTYGKENIKLEDIVAALLAHDQRKKNNATGEFLDDVLHVRGDHGSDEKKGKKKKKKGALCYKCFNHGHIRKYCPELKKDGRTANAVIANRKDDSDSDGDLLTVSTEKSCEAWLLDSANSFHATPKKECFLSYTEVDNGGRAYLGDGSAYQVMGVGDIKFKMCGG